MDDEKETLLRRLQEANGKIDGLLAENDELQTSLTEEHWLTEAQKEEIKRLTSELSEVSKKLETCQKEKLEVDTQYAGLKGSHETEKQTWIADLRELAEEKLEWEKERQALCDEHLGRIRELEVEISKCQQRSNGDDCFTVTDDTETSPSVVNNTTDSTGDANISENNSIGDGLAVHDGENEIVTQLKKKLTAAIQKIATIEGQQEQQAQLFTADNEALSKQVQVLRLDSEAHTDQISQLLIQRDQLVQELDAVKFERNGLTANITLLQTELNASHARIQHFESSGRQRQQEFDELQANYVVSQDTVRNHDTRIRALEQQLREKEAELRDLNSQVSVERLKTQSLTLELNEAEDFRNQLSVQIQDMEQEKSMFAKHLSDAEHRVDEITTRWNTVSQEKTALVREMHQLKNQSGVMQKEVEDVRAHFQLLTASAKERENECVVLKVQVARLLENLEAAGLVNSELCNKLQELQVRTPPATPTATWQADNEVLECNGCQSMFSLTRRRHHCRGCGRIYCDECTQNRLPLWASRNPVRVCASCFVST